MCGTSTIVDIRRLKVKRIPLYILCISSLLRKITVVTKFPCHVVVERARARARESESVCVQHC